MTYNKIIFDSCIFIAFYNSEDTLDIFKFHKDDMIIISNYVIQEVSTVLTYRF